MSEQDPNFITEAGASVPRRRLETFTISFNRISQRFTVQDDCGFRQIVGAGYASADDAERAHTYHDQQRVAAEPQTPGRTAYEAECAAWPLYHDGTPRVSWVRLPEYVRANWERNPTPRFGSDVEAAAA